jgi:hypothetical protein
MTIWILWAVAATTLLGIAALFAERALLGRGSPTRWIWVGAIAGALGLQLWSWVRPSPTPSPVGYWTSGSLPELAVGSSSGPATELSRLIARLSSLASDFGARAESLDMALTFAWPSMSVLLLILLAGGLVRIVHAARGWRRMRLEDGDVLVAPNFGPALVGIVRPEIVLPEWSLQLDRELLRIAWLHEAEHRAARDTLVVFAGALAVVATPWNVPLWWMVSRLRQSVEIDCDRRVLKTGIPWARYGEVLLACAARVRPPPIPALALGRPIPLLERRLTVMITRPASNHLATTAGIAAAVTALTLAACEAPAPTDVGPPTNEASASVPTGVSARTQAGQELSRRFALGDGEPLIIVDGEETDRSFSELDPVGIERIEVLRGDAAREWYGDRGVNGVVVVTTSEAADAETLGRVMDSYEPMASQDAVDHEPDVGFRVRRTEAGPAVVTAANLPDDVEVYVDGVLHEGGLDEIDPDRIDRIEVLRGEAPGKIYITLK